MWVGEWKRRIAIFTGGLRVVAISELTALLGAHARKATAAEDLHKGILRCVSDLTNAGATLLYLWDNAGIRMPLPSAIGEVPTHPQLVLAAELGGVLVRKEMQRVFVKGNTLETIQPDLLQALGTSSGGKWEVVSMVSGEELEGIVCLLLEKPLPPDVRTLIEASLYEATIMLDLVTDRFLQLRLVELNQVGLSSTGETPSRFMCRMLTAAREYIGCAGISFFHRDPGIDDPVFWLVGTAPNPLVRGQIDYRLGDNSLTSRLLFNRAPCAIHYLECGRKEIDSIGPSKWRDVSTEVEARSVMYIPVGSQATVALLRCTNKENAEGRECFNAVDIHKAEAIASLMSTWHAAVESDFRLESSLMDLSHELITTAAGIKSMASYTYRALTAHTAHVPDKDILLLKLKDITSSIDSLLAMMPALRKSADISPPSRLGEAQKGFRPYADLCKPIIESFTARANERGVKIRCVGEYQLGILYGALHDFWPILHNLISNAVKYTEAGREILVKLDRGSIATEFSAIHVLSESLPIYKDEREQIFRFRYRTEAAKKRDRGEGRGLAIARTKARQFKGDVVLTVSGDFNLFSILIPKQLFAKPK